MLTQKNIFFVLTQKTYFLCRPFRLCSYLKGHKVVSRHNLSSHSLCLCPHILECNIFQYTNFVSNFVFAALGMTQKCLCLQPYYKEHIQLFDTKVCVSQLIVSLHTSEQYSTGPALLWTVRFLNNCSQAREDHQ